MKADTCALTRAERFFYGLAEQTFQTQLGVVDPALTDYLSGLLYRFIHYDALFKIRTLEGRPVTEVGQMFVEAEQRLGNARFQTFLHIGDFTLFWAGIYPESLRARRDEETDLYRLYCDRGRKAYDVARDMKYKPESH